MSFHRLLERQLKRIFGVEPDLVPDLLDRLNDADRLSAADQVNYLKKIPALLNRVSDSYAQLDRDLALVRRSLELSSTELTEANQRLLEEGRVTTHALSTLKDAFGLLLEGYAGDGETSGDINLADISDKVLWMTRERERMRQALKESEERFDLAMQGSNDGLWDWNLVSGSVYFSPRWKDMIGYGVDEIRDQTSEWADRIHPEDFARVKQVLDDTLAGQASGYECMFRFRHRDGHYLWILSRGRVVRDETGKPVRLVGTHTDLSALKNTEMQLQLAKERAEKASQAKSDFLSSMSHELRTPLNAILGFGQILQQDSSIPVPQRDASREIVKAGRHLLSLINEVLDLARIESGKMDVALVPVSLRMVFDEVRSLAEPVAQDHGISLNFADAAERAVNADPIRLKQVLLNLVTNAIKYNRPNGSVDVIVEVGENDCWRIGVMDTGVGISPEKQEQLFQPFNRLGHEGGTIQGSGIGLVITKKYIEGMGGRIGLFSRVGRGSMFWVEFSKATLSVDMLKSTSDACESKITPGITDILPSPENSIAIRNGEKKKLLYVDDNDINLMLMEGLLADRQDIELLALQNSRECIELVRKEKPVLIMLDIFMPDPDGFALLEALRESPDLRHIAVVAVTANAMQHDVDKAMAAGFDAYLTKPIEMDQLDAMLAKMLN